MPCQHSHRVTLDENALHTELEKHQKHGYGRHKCCQCAYNIGFDQGVILSANPVLDITRLGDSQADADGRHRSVHQAFARGYHDGVSHYIHSNK
ncbi:hypothetical protein V3H21_22625 [Vibrio parahaemolyticus]|uniref:hypothetical protein n=1 Tax=Vibrio parahaemolyticus TaxID=670 RepID=UPI003B66D858|nr:hypothetical protein [Vibrio parahaemolyticus]